jgi:hypothetical protein
MPVFGVKSYIAARRIALDSSAKIRAFNQRIIRDAESLGKLAEFDLSLQQAAASFNIEDSESVGTLSPAAERSIPTPESTPESVTQVPDQSPESEASNQLAEIDNPNSAGVTPALPADLSSRLMEAGRRMDDLIVERRKAREQKSGQLRFQEAALFGIVLVAASLTVVLATLGIAFVFMGLIPVATVAAALAILPGAGTAILWRQMSSIRETRGDLEKQVRDEWERHQRVEAALNIEDSSRRDAAIFHLVTATAVESREETR